MTDLIQKGWHNEYTSKLLGHCMPFSASIQLLDSVRMPSGCTNIAFTAWCTRRSTSLLTEMRHLVCCILCHTLSCWPSCSLVHNVVRKGIEVDQEAYRMQHDDLACCPHRSWAAVDLVSKWHLAQKGSLCPRIKWQKSVCRKARTVSCTDMCKMTNLTFGHLCARTIHQKALVLCHMCKTCQKVLSLIYRKSECLICALIARWGTQNGSFWRPKRANFLLLADVLKCTYRFIPLLPISSIKPSYYTHSDTLDTEMRHVLTSLQPFYDLF